ncbi:hypothetical protein FHL15_007701 [Xylaria flabelliformis]|uniref:Uncharacterized protein n=1 Tax=Xylaria flabelliformis TaxID=2512241 RepID=A0A553HU74_9PEZI|nr:hypothetical protein FHL15_007701 [Xylaria flabelliformis]
MSSALNNEVKARRSTTPSERFRIAEAWRDVGNRERTVLEEAMDRAMMDPHISERDKILLRMRTDAEGDLRNGEHGCSAYTPCCVSFPQNWSECYHDFWKISLCCRNTMTALYVLDDRQRFPYVDAMDIETWFWRQWFHPYTTELELGRSFVQIFAVDYNTSNLKGSDIRPDDLISLHCDICEQSERFKEAICTNRGPNSPPSMSGPLRGLPWPHSWNDKIESCGYTFIQPLFRALFMVLVYPKEQMPLPKDSRWVAQAQVQLVLTGITDGLSAPIRFDEILEYATGNAYTPGNQTITTTLDIATKFILRLEQREVAAFGVQPNICSLNPTTPYLLAYRKEAKKLGWIEERDGRLDELSPRSSEWVDRTLFPKWFGRGALQTMEYALELRKYRKWLEPEQYTKDWWWNRQDLPESPNTHDA